ncbi:Cytochrome P450 [Cordyceps fumosorosea ARSEF 2679]|uniref:Cytochrome P450 n=1 Tax=Cordyceps fumosorosea (strain ARSEF 2679) TaxID=1081104 RepID=A0A167LKZ8_CORFA|nr:Cytochrome P450 [Cordyceps fumosorosea ARSEF 2679]OAA53207.1 Cytochrome P450 [Cordyceps fumosorosea ARSEF 2679]
MALHAAYLFIAATLTALYVVRCIRQRNAFDKQAQQLGCEPLTLAFNKLPFGLDRKWQIVTHRGNILDDLITTRFAELGCYIYTDNQWGCPPIICAEPATMKAVLSTKFRDWDMDSNRYPALGPWLGRGVLVSSHQGKGSLWATARALLRPIFANAATYDYSLVEKSVADFVSAVGHVGEKGAPTTTDILPLIRRLNIDIILTVFCGGSISELKPASAGVGAGPQTRSVLEEAFDVIEPIAGLRLQTGGLYWMFTSKPFRAACDTFSELANGWINQALSKTDEKPASQRDSGDAAEKERSFTEALVSSTGDRELLRDILVQLLFAGIDTSTSMLSFAILELGRHPRAWARLRAELASHDLLFGPPTSAQLKECTFLQNVIRETLRLYPPVPINSREAVRDTVLPTGGGADGASPVLVRRGTSLKYSPYVMHRRSDLYGPDALEWNPDRWLTRTPGWDYLPFNGGPRVCIGQKFALGSGPYVLARLAQQFDTCEAVLTAGPIESKLGAVLIPVGGVPVSLSNSRG